MSKILMHTGLPMNKIKSFFFGCAFLGIVFAMVFLVALVYRANERASIKTYIFQTGDFANQRVGELQDINDIKTEDLRNKLFKKYVSEYFKVIPGDTSVTNRPILKNLSTDGVFKKWENGEAKNIASMSDKKMFRMVRVHDKDIKFLKGKKDVNYSTSDTAEKIYYEIRYHMATWSESNRMGIQPVYEDGTMFIEARFKPGIRPDISVREYLESGKDPVGLFMFEVTNVGSKENI